MRYEFGDKLRAVRERRGETIRAVAERAGVSESLVSQIERNRVMPAVDTLLRLAEVQDIDLEYLFSDFRRRKPVTIVRKADRPRFEKGGVVYEQLSKSVDKDRTHGMEAYYLEVAPGAEKGSSEYGHIGMEMGIVLDGGGELRIGGETHTLAAGDSCSFASDVPHALANTGKKTLKAYWVVTPPKTFEA